MLERLVRVTRSRSLLAGVVLALLLIPVLWVWPQRGLTARYHDNTDWKGDPIATRVEPRLTLEAVEAAGTTLPQQRFALVMEGWLRIDDPGEYGFSTRSDDGSTLDVAGQRVVDNGGYHAPRTASGAIQLDRGFHPVLLRYIQGGGAYSLRVTWMPPGVVESGIPTSHLYVAPSGVPGVATLTRHSGALWRLAWLVLALVAAGRVLHASRATGPGHLRTLGVKAAVVLGSVVVTLLIVEVAARVAGFALADRRALGERLSEERVAGAGDSRIYSLGDIVQPSPFEGIVYELKPNLRGVFAGRSMATNSRGLRDAEYGVDKPSGAVRVVALGDSSLFGWGVSDEEVSLEVLERRLNGEGAGPPVEILNFATPGYNTAIEAEVFVRKALRYDPDVVLVNFNTNDYDVPAFMKLPESAATLRRSYVFDFLYSRYEAWTGVPPRELPVFDFTTRTLSMEEADNLDQDPGLPDEYRYMVGTRGFERALDKLMTAARAADVDVVVFDVRPYPGLHPTYERNRFRDSQRELLERLSDEKGFHWLNTYPYYADYLTANPDAPFPRVFAVSDTDSHPSVLAHQINANALYDYLTEQGWVE